MQEKRVDDYWNCRFEQKLVTFVERFHEVHSIEKKKKKKPPQGLFLVQERIDKSSNNYETRSRVARSMDENW